MRITFHEWQNIGADRKMAGPGENDVEVWLGGVPDGEAELSACLQILNEPERLRVERFQVPKARNEFVFGRAMMRLILGSVLKTDPAEISIDYDKRGKPRLGGGFSENDLSFNLAHSHSLVAMALTRGRAVGIDIEWMQREVDWSLIAGRIFSADELGELRSLPESQQSLAFFMAWTRKEAYLKATGEGLSDEISAIEVTMNPGSPPGFVRLPKAAKNLWDIHNIPLPPGFAGALVVEGYECALPERRVGVERIL